MKKVGFIDYYLWNFHANKYPEMIKKYSGGEMEVAYAYAAGENPQDKEHTNAMWSETYGVPLLSSIEEVVEKSDFLVVLSPDNPEKHEALCRLPLQSGKRVYVDKTFAPDKETAKRIFALAEASNTPCFSASALHFADEYAVLAPEQIETLRLASPSIYEIYSIHQIEPIVRLMDEEAKRVMCVGKAPFAMVIIEFASGRLAQLACYPNGGPMMATVGFTDMTSRHFEIKSPYFDNFVKGMVKFFKTGEIPVPHSQTIQVIAIREAGLKALKKPFTWIEV